MKRWLLPLIIATASAAHAREKIADKDPGSLLYDQPFAVIPGVFFRYRGHGSAHL